jgi:iron complex outermembrane receptor protein
MPHTTACRTFRPVSQAVRLALGLTVIGSAFAQTVAFNIPEQDAAAGILEFARQAKVQIIAPADKLKGLRTHTVVGALDARAALAELLRGTGLTVASDDGHTLSLRLGATPAKLADPPTTQAEPISSSEQQLTEIIIQGVSLKYRPTDQSSATGLAMPLIDTPQAISVVTGNMMKVIDAQSIYSATDLVPGAISEGSGFGINRIMLRGVNNSYERVNGLELNALQYPLDSYALERVEVVRGPATAIYGVTGSFGGEINSILKRPSQNAQAEFEFEDGSFDTTRYGMDVTGPLSDSVSGRFVARYDDYRPALDNGTIRDHEEMYLGALSWRISGDTTSTLWWYHGNRAIDPYDGGPLFLANGKLSLPPDNIDPLTWYFSNPRQSIEQTEFDLLFMELVHSFANGWEFNADASYDRYEQGLDYFYPYGPFGAYGQPATVAPIYSYDISRHSGAVTVDVSLRGDFDLFGRKQSFYTALEGDDTTEPNNFTLLNSVGSGLIDAYQGGLGITTTGAPIPTVNTAQLPIREIENTTFKDIKGSVELLLNPVDRLKLLVGVLAHHGENINTIPISGSTTLAQPNVQDISFTKIVKRVGGVYDFVQEHGAVDGVNGYLNYSEGFQPQIIVNKEAIAQSFPQNMKQYEAGVKADFLNHAVGSSIAVYNYTITNVPATNAPLGSFGAFGTTVADGTQKATGVEVETVGEFVPGWNLTANYAYTDAQLTNPAYTFAIPLANLPKHKGTIASSYEFLDGPLRGLRAGAMVVSSSDYAYILGFPKVVKWGQLIDGAYTRLDLNASYKFPDRYKGLELYLNVRNVFNDRILLSKQGSPSYGVVFEDVRGVFAGIRYGFFTK